MRSLGANKVIPKTQGEIAEVPASGKYRSLDGPLFPDEVDVLFSDAPLLWEQDRFTLGHYVDWVMPAAQSALEKEEVVLVSVYPVWHGE